MRRKKKIRAYPKRLPFTLSQILAWADAHHQRIRQWPNLNSGRITGSFGETWRRVDSALRLGLRGLPGGASLALFLAERRGIRNQTNIPPLTIAQVLRWADAHYHRTGSWPRETSGAIHDAPGETWVAVDRAMRVGIRGLRSKTSLARVLAKHRGVRNIQGLAPLLVKQILRWADAHYRRTKIWPTTKSGPIRQAPGETWSGVNAALRSGRRGFSGGYSLPRLLARHRGVRNSKAPPNLAIKQILRWAHAYHHSAGRWPSWHSGPVTLAAGETWAMVDRALRKGQRGLPGGVSLFRLLAQNGMANSRARPARS
jgi:hypothetical protein